MSRVRDKAKPSILLVAVCPTKSVFYKTNLSLYRFYSHFSHMAEDTSSDLTFEEHQYIIDNIINTLDVLLIIFSTNVRQISFKFALTRDEAIG